MTEASRRFREGEQNQNNCNESYVLEGKLRVKFERYILYSEPLSEEDRKELKLVTEFPKGFCFCYSELAKSDCATSSLPQKDWMEVQQVDLTVFGAGCIRKVGDFFMAGLYRVETQPDCSCFSELTEIPNNFLDGTRIKTFDFEHFQNVEKIGDHAFSPATTEVRNMKLLRKVDAVGVFVLRSARSGLDFTGFKNKCRSIGSGSFLGAPFESKGISWLGTITDLYSETLREYFDRLMCDWRAVKPVNLIAHRSNPERSKICNVLLNIFFVRILVMKYMPRSTDLITIVVQKKQTQLMRLDGVSPASPILVVKGKIYDHRHNLKIANQRLVFRNRELEDDNKALADYGITENRACLELFETETEK